MSRYSGCRPGYCGAFPWLDWCVCGIDHSKIMHDKNHCSNCGYGPTKRLVNGRCDACPPLEVMREKIKEPIKDRKGKMKSSKQIIIDEMSDIDSVKRILKDAMKATDQEFMEAFDEYMRNYNASEDKVWYKKGKQRNWSDFPVEEK